jgi:hypothetical protein
LEFERQHVGERINCPLCGMETLLYIPPSAPPIVQSPPPVSAAQGEAVFLSEGGITVTKTRFMVHGQTYALANITSVSAATIPAKRGGAIALFLIGPFLSLIGFGVMSDGSPDDRPVGIFLLILGVILVGVGILVFKALKDSYAVVLSTAGSEMKTCVSRDGSFILRVVAALNEAIVARG